jgi:hypothetical protein
MYGLVRAVATLRLVEAVPSVAEDLPRSFAAEALAELGPDAAAALPRIDQVLREASPAEAAALERLRWRITGDPAPARALAAPLLAEPATVAVGAELAAALGPLAAELAPILRARWAEATPEADPHGWGRVGLAVARWKTAAEAEVDGLLAVWDANPAARGAVARHLGELGPLPAAAVDRLRDELAGVQRRAMGTATVSADRALVAACRAALANSGR